MCFSNVFPTPSSTCQREASLRPEPGLRTGSSFLLLRRGSVSGEHWTRRLPPPVSVGPRPLGLVHVDRFGSTSIGPRRSGPRASTVPGVRRPSRGSSPRVETFPSASHVPVGNRSQRSPAVETERAGSAWLCGIRLVQAEGACRNRTGVNGFAGRCVTTPPRRRKRLPKPSTPGAQ